MTSKVICQTTEKKHLRNALVVEHFIGPHKHVCHFLPLDSVTANKWANCSSYRSITVDTCSVMASLFLVGEDHKMKPRSNNVTFIC